MQWEYCAVVGVFHSYMNRHLAPKYPAIWRFTPNGVQVTEIKSRDPEQVTLTIAQLGEEGWEMVGCGNLDVAEHAIYFKRPRLRQEDGQDHRDNGRQLAEQAPGAASS